MTETTQRCGAWQITYRKFRTIEEPRLRLVHSKWEQTVDQEGGRAMKKDSAVVTINEAKIREHLGELVRGSVEETLNGLLDEEADRICGAKRYERNTERVDTRAGYYQRGLETSSSWTEVLTTSPDMSMNPSKYIY